MGGSASASARRGEALVREDAVEAAGDERHEEAGGELAGPGDEAVVVLVALADHALGLVAGVVVEIFLELALDDAALLLDDEHLLLVADEGERGAPGERPDHADLVDVDAEAAAGGLVEAEEAQRLHQVEVALAGGDEAVARLGRCRRGRGRWGLPRRRPRRRASSPPSAPRSAGRGGRASGSGGRRAAWRSRAG